jgi:hypothetical protein
LLLLSTTNESTAPLAVLPVVLLFFCTFSLILLCCRAPSRPRNDRDVCGVVFCFFVFSFTVLYSTSTQFKQCCTVRSTS